MLRVFSYKKTKLVEERASPKSSFKTIKLEPGKQVFQVSNESMRALRVANKLSHKIDLKRVLLFSKLQKKVRLRDSPFKFRNETKFQAAN